MEEKGATGSIISALRLNGLDYTDKHQTIVVNQDSYDSCEKAFGKLAAGLGQKK